MEKTLGGDRLGSGKKLKVSLHGYERSTHDMGYLWRSTMSAGTLVPFMSELALPGDTFDINLDCDIKTHPTIGPLFGSYKVQLDVFQAPVRLYQGQLHNNKLGIGLSMSNVKLPVMRLNVDGGADIDPNDPDNAQINPSCIFSYLGIRGIGMADPTENPFRDFNAIPYLAYWDIYKNYYANKQEGIGYVIHKELIAIITTVTTVTVNFSALVAAPATVTLGIGAQTPVTINFTGATPRLDQIIFNTSQGPIQLDSVATAIVVTAGTKIDFIWDYNKTGFVRAYNWTYVSNSTIPLSEPTPVSFDLDDIDMMREQILSFTWNSTTPFQVDLQGLDPYKKSLDWVANLSPYLATQEGLGLKTYNSDLFNNWLSTEWIDGSGGINDITAIDTSSGSFNIDTLNLSKKVYDMLNRIAVSGGTYDDWLDAVYTHDRYIRTETPVYHGGLIKELVFQEVVSNSESVGGNIQTQPLGTLAGRGILSKKHKGGQITIKVDEPSYIIGIISLTPRIDYSQGNKWDVNLKTMDDFHKPALDEIGFQELITEQMAWWTTYKLAGDPTWYQRSAGKQPAWINYMTNVNQVRGNFAVPNNEMFMTLNRRYEWDGSQTNPHINDLTTYIDPSKYNNIFAYTAIDSQNFWAQIAVDITARRKMSAKIMPNL